VVVKAAARNWRSGKEVIDDLLEQKGDGFEIIHGLVEQIAMSFLKIAKYVSY
jgi:hypothetical protein